MDENSNHNPGNVPLPAAEFGTVQNGSENFRIAPKASAGCGNGELRLGH
jgi:hypothetical protein